MSDKKYSKVDFVGVRPFVRMSENKLNAAYLVIFEGFTYERAAQVAGLNSRQHVFAAVDTLKKYLDLWHESQRLVAEYLSKVGDGE